MRDISNVDELLVDPKTVLYEHIIEDICEKTNPDAKNIDKNTIFSGVLLLDGLDEISILNNLNTSIEIFCEKLLQQFENLKTKIILTSRHGYIDIEKLEKRNLPAIVVQIKRFNQEQQIEWLEKYLKNSKQQNIFSIEDLKEINQIEKYKHIKELIDQPILLHLVALSGADIKTNNSRASVYNQVFTNLVDRTWESNCHSGIIRGVSKDNLRHYLQDIAFEIFKFKRDFIKKTELESLESSKRFMQEIEKENDIKNILKYLMISFYMQTKEYEKKLNQQEYAIEFLHKSLQEYLVAEKIWRQITRFEDDTVEDFKSALFVVWEIFSIRSFSQEIRDYIREYAHWDSNSNKQKIFVKMLHFSTELLMKNFILTTNQSNPVYSGVFTFVMYWEILGIVANGQNTVPEVKEQKDIFVNLLKISQVLTPSQWNLRGGELSFQDFSFLNLQKSNFSGANLRNIIFKNSLLDDSNFGGAIMQHAKMFGASLTKSKFIQTDLSFADLSFVDLRFSDLTSATLKKTNLTQANLSECCLNRVDFTDSVLNQINIDFCDLNSATFNQIDLSYSIIRGSDFRLCSFKNSKLKNISFLNSKLYKVRIIDTDLKGVRCHGISDDTMNSLSVSGGKFVIEKSINVALDKFQLNMEKIGLSLADFGTKEAQKSLENISFDLIDKMELVNIFQKTPKLNRYVNVSESYFFKSILTNGLLYYADFTSSTFNEVDISEVDFTGSIFYKAKFLKISQIKNTNFTNTNFEEAMLSDITFKGGSFKKVNMNKTCLNYCNMSDLEISESLFIESDISNTKFIKTIFLKVNLSNVNAKEANFERVSATDVLFVNANLEGTIFDGTIFKNVDFTGANLKNVDFTYADFTNVKVSVEQLCRVKTLYGVKGLGSDIIEKIKTDGYGHLF